MVIRNSPSVSAGVRRIQKRGDMKGNKGTRSTYLMDLLSLRLVGAMRARNSVRSLILTVGAQHA